MFPAGVATGTVQFGAALGSLGGLGVIKATIEVDRPLLHVASGTTIYPVPEPMNVDGSGICTAHPAFVDQAGFRDLAGNDITGWGYVMRATIEFPGINIPPQNRMQPFKITSDQTGVVDLDLLFSSGTSSPPATSPAAYVSSFAGQTGAVTEQQVIDALGPVLSQTFAPLYGSADRVLSGGFVPGTDVPGPKRRRAQFAFGGSGDTVNSIGGLTDAQQRIPFILQFPTARWRLRVRNCHSDGTSLTGAFNFNGVWAGPAQLSGADGFPNGAFAAAPTKALNAFSTPADGASDTVTAWVTDPSVQFAANQISLISMGWTTSATQIARGCGAMFYEAGTGASGHAGNQPPPGGQASNIQLDIRLEYEFVGGGRVYLALGDSLTEAFYADAPTLFNYGTWHQRFAQRNRIAMCASACYGFTINQFLDTSAWNWTRWANSGLTIDGAMIQLGTNDANALHPLADVQGYAGTLLNNLRAIGIQDVFWNTIAPRSAGDWTTTKENLRTSYNRWLRQMPFNLRGVPDVDRALADPFVAATASQTLLPAFASSDLTHWTPAGQQRAAEAVGAAVLVG